jgi:hypothetical protein
MFLSHLLVRPTSSPGTSNLLDGIVDLPSKPGSSAQVNLPPTIVIGLPCLPVVNRKAFATDGRQETLSRSVLAVALELEGQALEAAVVPGAVALPISCHGCWGGSSYKSCDSCEGELHIGKELCIWIVKLSVVRIVACLLGL